MTTHKITIFCGSLIGFFTAVVPLGAAEVDEAFFETRIRPVLVQRCFECHGRDQAKNALRVDSREALVKGGDSGAAIVPGDASKSLLVRAIRRSDENLQMPPKSTLSETVVADFVRWINDGAAWPAFEPVKTRRVVAERPVETRSPDDPRLIRALQVWFKADGQPWKDGQAVSLWEDASGRGHDLAATAGARRGGTGRSAKFVAQSAIVGFPAVRFGVESGLGGNAASAPEIAGDAEFTMFVVARIQNDPQSQGLVAGFGEPATPGNTGRARCAIIGLQPGGAGQPVFVGGWGNDAIPAEPTGPAVLDGPPVIIALTKHRGPLASTSHFHVNGHESAALKGSMELPEFGRRDDLGFFMGHAQSWLRGFTGDVAEVLLYNRSLESQERNGIEAHLSAKYRIPLAAAQREQIVDGGDPAFSPPHWAFEPMKKVSPPTSADPSLSHPVDRFVAAKWVQQGLKFVEPADARILVRRLYFDLIGLPPSPAEMEQSVAALTPWNDTAWAALIDRLLDSPHYGERWGRHWLDVVRYADTAGDNADYPVPEARLYRDYVIDSFNADKPYDQFVREQLAGDILAADTPSDRYAESVTATGFLALSRRYATGPYELWHLTLEDTIDTVGQAFMGLTLRCARCHDHKFDPVTQHDYYALYGIFESTQFPWAGAEEFQSQKQPRQHFVPLIPSKDAEPLLAAHAEAEKQLAVQITELEKDGPQAKSLASLAEKIASLKAASANAAEIAVVQTEHDKVKQQLEASKAALRVPFEAARRRGFPDTVPIAYSVREGVPRPAVLQRSGDPGQAGAVVARGVPAFLTTREQVRIPESQSGRRQFAEWLTRPDHPLTARVMVNRIWQHHFGRGLVATPSNFGLRGVAPTHPELLDWLALSFVDNGWSVKAVHRLILTSRVWRLSSADEAQNATLDPVNAFLWHHDRQRLQAETIRDAMLATGGRLDLSRPGAHPFPPITNWTYTQHNQFRDFYPSRHRSVYLMVPRLQRHPFLALFDGPDTNTTTGSRTSSIVPAQALYLMNSAEVKEEANAFAEVVLKAPAEARIDTAYGMAFQRKPTAEEMSRAAEFLATYTGRAGAPAAWAAFCRVLLTSHEFFQID